jgi:hypothetical protein
LNEEIKSSDKRNEERNRGIRKIKDGEEKR